MPPVGFEPTIDQLLARTSTWQHTTLTTDRHPCPRWDSNRRSQQASGRRPTPWPRGHRDRRYFYITYTIYKRAHGLRVEDRWPNCPRHVCPSARLSLDGFKWSLVLGASLKICREIPILVTLGKNYQAPYMKNQICFIVTGIPVRMEETGWVPGAGTDDMEKNKKSLAPTAIRIPDRPAHSLVSIPTTQSLLATNNLLGTLFANKK